MYAQEVIPFFLKKKDGSGGIKGLARSMPTSSALDNVAKFLGKPTCQPTRQNARGFH